MTEHLIETSILGIILGALIRLLPEFVSIINKLIDNKHEITMLEKSKITQSNTYQDREVMSNNDINLDYIDLISKVQQKKTGILYVDIIRALVRPYVTYILLSLYVGMKIIYLILNPTAPFGEIYTSDDIGILSGVLSFWFLGRVLEKK